MKKNIMKLLNLFNKIEKDKALHFLSGSVLLSFYLLFLNDLYSILAVAISAAAKELIWDDLLKEGTHDKLDFFCSIAPCVLYLINILI